MKRRSQEAAVTAGGSGCGCSSSCCDTTSVSMPSVMTPKSTKTVSTVKAIKFSKSSIKLDKAGYFVILPQKKKANILVEQYSNDNKFLRKIEGKNCRDIYLTIISNKWVTDLGHAAYLGKELSRAEASLKSGDKFVQDSA